MAIQDVNHKVCKVCDFYDKNDCPYCGMAFEGFSLKEHDAKVRADAIDECFKKIEQNLHDNTEISLNLPVEEVLGDDVDVDGFLMLAEVIVQKYKGLIFSKLKKAKHQLKEQKDEEVQNEKRTLPEGTQQVHNTSERDV